MNGQRFTLGIIILSLALCCMTQSYLVGCSSTEAGGDLPEVSVDLPDDREQQDSETGFIYVPLPKLIVEQLSEMYGDRGFNFSTIEKANGGHFGLFMRIGERRGFSSEKQAIDGFYIMYANFPDLNLYTLEIEGAESEQYSAEGDALRNILESGYTLDSSQLTASNMMNLLDGPGKESGSVETGTVGSGTFN